MAINDEMNIGVSASIDSQILIYDMKNLNVRHKINPTQFGGFTQLRFSSFPIKTAEDECPMLYAASTLGDFFIIEVRTGKTIH